MTSDNVTEAEAESVVRAAFSAYIRLHGHEVAERPAEPGKPPRSECCSPRAVTACGPGTPAPCGSTATSSCPRTRGYSEEWNRAIGDADVSVSG
ncbi:hypothetical protein [Streptomyces sp. TRM49041]|uniref:hypothetical protein n=1 Tax=Streptomyces sp. TRM49041 TaxID=2603216 RepID=UPI0011EE7B70|nr:hypothetical protein [Streptomyces sp. TRM49041]